MFWFYVYFIFYFVRNPLSYLKSLQWKSDYINYDDFSGNEILAL